MTKALMITLSLVSSLAFAANDMNHNNMDHGNMEHGKMDHSKMDHSMMNMSGMSAVGMPAKGAKADKVVHVILSDDKPIQFKKQVEIKPNDVVQFVVMNTGSKVHEFAIGSEAELAKHSKMMQQMAGMEHDTNSSIIVEAKKARQFTWHFHGDNKVSIDCNIKGHDQHGQSLTLNL
ncbi:copper-binding protein [Vibrio ponticus]|uniref:Copper-binding protein n=1 Tax=Vibrio ponticus TaxID=265668 RepID=A0A3N3DZ16_9VIBR|nr:copper-binding protein [Vibrio ponticus]ROV59629.1 copper-binding protein [Vibrio ponticus]